jgi:hypothetical protein
MSQRSANDWCVIGAPVICRLAEIIVRCGGVGRVNFVRGPGERVGIFGKSLVRERINGVK